MKITLLRHGEVQEKYLGKYNGHIDIQLSENGKTQAKKAAKELNSIAFERVYCSDLLRAKETLNAFHFHQNIIYSNQLREKSWGRHEGKSFDEIVAEGIEYESFLQWIEALDGESMAEYIEKVKTYFYETLLKENAQNILVVTHSGFIKTLLHITNDISLEEAFGISLPYGSSITLDTISL